MTAVLAVQPAGKHHGAMAINGNLQALLRKRRSAWPAGASSVSTWRAIASRGVILLVLAAISGCSREAADPPAQRVSAPAAAVLRQAEHLRHNDLRGFARDAVPPAHFKALEASWRSGSSRWPLTELPLHDQIEPMLLALTAPDALRDLKQSFDHNLANQGKDLREAAVSLGSFGVQYVQREGEYSAQERAHYVQVINALSEWARQAKLGDPARADAAISKLAAAARTSGFNGESSLREAGMEASLVRLEPFFAATKNVLASYGLSIDRSLDGLRAELVTQQGGVAQVRIRYPLAGREVETVVDLERRGGRWYLVDQLREGERALQALKSRAPPAAEDIPDARPDMSLPRPPPAPANE